MKYYPPNEYQHCLEVARIANRGGGLSGVEDLHALLMEQRALALEGVFERCQQSCEDSFNDGVAAEHERLTDGDWNQATAANLSAIRASEKHYRLLLEAAQIVAIKPSHAVELLQQWNQEQAEIQREFDEAMSDEP